jgi:hypothetical protein
MESGRGEEKGAGGGWREGEKRRRGRGGKGGEERGARSARTCIE